MGYHLQLVLLLPYHIHIFDNTIHHWSLFHVGTLQCFHRMKNHLQLNYHNNKLYRSERFIPSYSGAKTIDDCLESINSLFDSNCLSTLCNKLINRRVFFDKLLREDMFLYEDLEYCLRLLQDCKVIYFFQDVIYQYYQANHGSQRMTRMKSTIEITDKINTALDGLRCDNGYILDQLSDVLYRGKIKSMSLSEVKEYYPNEYYKQLFGRPYWRLRHTVANWIKQHFGDFRKW